MMWLLFVALIIHLILLTQLVFCAESFQFGPFKDDPLMGHGAVAGMFYLAAIAMIGFSDPMFLHVTNMFPF